MRRTPILTSTPYQPPPPPAAAPRVNWRRWLPIVILLVLPLAGCVWGIIAILGNDRSTPSNDALAKMAAPPQVQSDPATVGAPSETPSAEPPSQTPPSGQQANSADITPPNKSTSVPPKSPAVTAAATPRPLTEEQKRINAAIDRGVEFLKKSQTPLGIWGAARNDGHAVGHAALPALALLECGVPGSDPVVQKAAAQVRFHASQVNMTYDLALAILFLDRLGEEKDVPLIQMFAARLISAQNAAGGWHYHCPLLQAADAKKLLNFLQASQPKLNNMIGTGQKPADPVPPAMKQSLDTPVAKDAKLNSAIAGEGVNPGSPSEPKKEASAKTPPPRIESLPVALRKLPVLMFNKKTGLVQNARDDNSNTQFALLGLWAARRHNVPVEKSLEMADLRFQKTQNRDGGWGYHVGQGTTATMTCVGLLGLAMGHGSGEAQKDKKALEDKTISDGLRALGKVLGYDVINFGRNEYYFLWSVERVGMLYDLKTIGGIEWYPWGTKIILPRQHGDGAWRIEPGYEAAIDTSFALLFLKRSNLVQDLSNRLNLYLAITDPAAASRR